MKNKFHFLVSVVEIRNKNGELESRYIQTKTKYEFIKEKFRYETFFAYFDFDCIHKYTVHLAPYLRMNWKRVQRTLYSVFYDIGTQPPYLNHILNIHLHPNIYICMTSKYIYVYLYRFNCPSFVNWFLVANKIIQ